MATKDYSKPRATASRLIAKFGQPGTIRRQLPNPGNPWEPGNSGFGVVNAACTLVATEYSAFERAGTLIQAGDRKILVSVGIENLPAYPGRPETENVPDTADQILVGGVAFSIVSIEPLDPGGTVLMWTIQARR